MATLARGASPVSAVPACAGRDTSGAPPPTRVHVPLKKQGRHWPTVNFLRPASQMSGAGGVPDHRDDDASSAGEECQLPSTASCSYDSVAQAIDVLYDTVRAVVSGVSPGGIPSAFDALTSAIRGLDAAREAYRGTREPAPLVRGGHDGSADVSPRAKRRAAGGDAASPSPHRPQSVLNQADADPTAGSPLPGYYIVECGAMNDCLYHTFAFLLQHAANREGLLPSLHPKDGVAPGDAHVHIRRIIQAHLKRHAYKMPLDARCFDAFPDLQTKAHTVGAYISRCESTPVAQYVKQNSKQNVNGGHPEVAAWAAMTNRPVVVWSNMMYAPSYVYMQMPDGTCDVDAYRATRAISTGNAWAVHNHIFRNDVSHFMPLVPRDALDPAVQPHRIDLNSAAAAWAHFAGRPDMMHEGSPMPMPVVKFKDAGPKSSTLALPPVPSGALAKHTPVFLPSGTRVGTIDKAFHSKVPNQFVYDVEVYESDGFETIQQQRARDMFEYFGDATNWPDDGLAYSAVVYCRDGQPRGGGQRRCGVGTVTGVALDWHGIPCYYEVTMQDEPSGKYYFESKWVSTSPLPEDHFEQLSSPPAVRAKPPAKK